MDAGNVSSLYSYPSQGFVSGEWIQSNNYLCSGEHFGVTDVANIGNKMVITARYSLKNAPKQIFLLGADSVDVNNNLVDAYICNQDELQYGDGNIYGLREAVIDMNANKSDWGNVDRTFCYYRLIIGSVYPRGDGIDEDQFVNISNIKYENDQRTDIIIEQPDISPFEQQTTGVRIALRIYNNKNPFSTK